MRRLADALPSSDAQQFYRSLVEYWPSQLIEIDGQASEVLTFDSYRVDGDFVDSVLGMAFVDSVTYLPDDILVKTDRATMSNSLEARVPFLDHRLVEYAATLPRVFKLQKGIGKILLRKIAGQYVPEEMFDRPKQGFGIPIDAWLRGPLREWADQLLNDRSTAVSKLIDFSEILRIWKLHISGVESHGGRIWVILMLQSWARRWDPTA